MQIPKNYIPYSIKSIALLLLSFVLFAGLTISVFAQESYLYVNTDENLKAVAAETPAEAIEKPTDIKSNSGVILSASFDALSEGSVLGISDTAEPIDLAPMQVVQNTSQELYAFVNTQGGMSYITSEDPTTALETATNIKPNSGVMLVVE